MAFMICVRRLLRVGIWLLLDILALATAAWVGFTNYSGLRTAFEISGLDMKPLAEDALLGPTFEAFGLGEATQADLYAFAVAAAVGAGTFLLFHLLFRALRLWRDHRDYVREGDAAMAAAAQSSLIFTLVCFGLTALVVTPAVYWDLVLFKLRVLAGTIGVTDPGGIWDLPDDDALLEKARGTLGGQLFRASPWGYLGVTACLSLLLEWAFARTHEAWAAAEEAIVNLFRRALPAPAPAVVAPAASMDESRDVVEAARLVEPERAVPVAAPPRPATPTALAAAHVMDAPPPDPAQPRVAVVDAGPAEEEFDVIGAPDERVTLAAALARPDRYVVDVEGRRVWDRTHYARLHGEPEPADATA